MAAVQGGQIDPEGEKDIKTEPLNDSTGNNNTSDGRPLSASPVASSSGGSNKSSAAGAEDQQTLLAVLQFLKKNKLAESVEILRREAGLSEEIEDSKGSESSGVGSVAGTGNVDTESGDANSLLSRVSSSPFVSSAPLPSAVQAPPKGPLQFSSRLLLGYNTLVS